MRDRAAKETRFGWIVSLPETDLLRAVLAILLNLSAHARPVPRRFLFFRYSGIGEL